MSDPTTPRTRTIRVEVAVDTDNLRKWADWHASHRHPDVAHALYRSAERYDDQASALERVHALHQPDPHTVSALYPEALCRSCALAYPCETAKALDGTS